MSSRQLEDAAEDHRAKLLASAVGITRDDLDHLEWRIEPHTSKDGLLYGYDVYFEEGGDPEILSKIAGLDESLWIRIDANSLDVEGGD